MLPRSLRMQQGDKRVGATVASAMHSRSAVLPKESALQAENTSRRARFRTVSSLGILPAATPRTSSKVGDAVATVMKAVTLVFLGSVHRAAHTTFTAVSGMQCQRQCPLVAILRGAGVGVANARFCFIQDWGRDSVQQEVGTTRPAAASTSSHSLPTPRAERRVGATVKAVMRYSSAAGNQAAVQGVEITARPGQARTACSLEHRPAVLFLPIKQVGVVVGSAMPAVTAGFPVAAHPVDSMNFRAAHGTACRSRHHREEPVKTAGGGAASARVCSIPAWAMESAPPGLGMTPLGVLPMFFPSLPMPEKLRRAGDTAPSAMCSM